MPRRTAPTPRFRKIFVVFMILVAVPSLAISGFGIMAIVDARAVAEARLASSYNARLRTLAKELAAELTRLEQQRPIEDGAPAEVAVREQAARAQALLPTLAARHFPSDGTVVELARDEEPEEAGPLTTERLRQRLQEWMRGSAQAPDLFRQDVVAELRLPPPLSEYRLRTRLIGDDLLAAQVRTTAALYTVLLIAFYVLLILGVTLVSVAMYREVQLGKLKTDFVSHVSHELRTPLTSIRMFLETLMMGRVRSKEEEQECLRMCAQETERLTGMIERVLDWAKIEAGKRTYDKRPMTVGEIVAKAVQAFRTQALEAPYTLTQDVLDADAQVMVDPGAIGDALLNLLHNAFKYTAEDKRIHVTVRASSRHVDVSVKDNGVGIPRSEQRRIFERFYRAEDLLTARTHGSGLGLALAKRIMEAHGGKVLVRSRPGEGSTFTLRLPRARGETAAGELQEKTS